MGDALGTGRGGLQRQFATGAVVAVELPGGAVLVEGAGLDAGKRVGKAPLAGRVRCATGVDLAAAMAKLRVQSGFGGARSGFLPPPPPFLGARPE